jgi:RimJ/RimL family protein N-acetyltransferase
MQPVQLRSERLLLDQLVLEDAPRVVEELRRPEIEHVLTTPWPYEPRHAEGFIGEVVPTGWATDAEYTWALRDRGVEHDGALAGVIGIRTARGDIGFWTAEAHRGRGLTAEAVRLVADWWFAQHPERPIVWECLVGNLGSMGVARAAGFRFTGTGPSAIPYRDGRHPDSWRGVLEPGPRRRHEGWPA